MEQRKASRDQTQAEPEDGLAGFLADPASKGESPEPTPDPFDLARLVLPQDFADRSGVKKLLINVPCRKPKGQEFVRVHPDLNFRHSLALLKLEEDRDEFYLLLPAIAAALPEECTFVTLFTTISRQGNLFFWPVREPDPSGRVLAWHTTARMAAEAAMQRWIRVRSNMTAGCYDVFEAFGVIADPEWPTDLNFQDLLRIAFKGHLIEDFEHPALQRLRGA